jgi:hypothetical protein
MSYPQATVGALTDVLASELIPLGTRRFVGPNEYIFLKGVASVVAGSWVSFDENHVTALLVAGAKGRVAIAKAAVDASTEFGWFQIYGKNTEAKALTGFADNGKIFATSTAGSVDDAEVAGDLVVNAIGRSAVAGGVITVELSYPFITAELGA